VSILSIILGTALAGAGLVTFVGAIRQLGRNRAFGAMFWSSLPHYFSYRVRALRPVGRALLGLALLSGGLLVLYLGIVGFYSARLGQPATH
jgi:hypothetical protein